MAEKRPVIENERIVFEGLFNVKELYSVINQWISDKGYVPVEKRTHESVSKGAKHIELELEPYKKFTDYAKSMIKIVFEAHDVTNVEITKDGHKRTMQKGKVQFTIDSGLQTDYEHRWETQAVFYIIRTLFEKYVYSPYLSGWIKQVRNDTNDLKEQIKAYLNLSRF